ncbi:hypothetical protein MKW94_010173 [Papaver nudicaule]|uniref:BHLH domain-containing protein n=1 Tax=Papaver nudicaule TaxID=74823 RepID=A0AA42AZ77_PAPNU|nr:hypothetical protein [Papaver nudicaule]MCL7045673.1 hypothetical protein [Papaver nudicaule]
MAEEYQSSGGICSGNWWNNNMKIGLSSSSSPACSTTLTDIGSSYSNWPAISTITDDQTVDMKYPKLNHQAASPSDNSVVIAGTNDVLIDNNSNLQMMGFDLSSPLTTSDWSQPLLSSRCSEDHQQKEWSPKNCSGSSGGEDSSSIHSSLKQQQINQGFSLDPQYCFNSNKIDNSNSCTGGLPMSFSMNSASYECTPSTSTLLQSLYDPENHTEQLQRTSYDEDNRMSYPSSTTSTNYHMNTNDQLSPSHSNWSSKFPQFLKTAVSSKQQPTNINNHLQFSNNSQFWNASPTSIITDDNNASRLFSSPQTQFLSPTLDDHQKSNCNNSLRLKPSIEEVQESSSVVKKSKSSEPAYKRPRMETPSQLPTFKVRKEKLGDRITALQQLCSPFGKTDTASVLYEAIEYIKFLHDQVTVLSNPYMKSGSAPMQYQQNMNKSKDGERQRQDLRSRGLCLVPMSSTFSVTNETSTDFWTPTFGGTYR